MSVAEDLWAWVVAAYGRPGVAEACLTLQNRHEQNVPLLLWAAWRATNRAAPDADTVEAACDIAHAWDGSTVGPLRTIRLRLKAAIPDMEDAGRLAVRERIKAVELAAERALLDDLAALEPSGTGRPGPVLDALVAVSRVWGAMTPRPQLALLAERLSA